MLLWKGQRLTHHLPDALRDTLQSLIFFVSDGIGIFHISFLLKNSLFFCLIAHRVLLQVLPIFMDFFDCHAVEFGRGRLVFFIRSMRVSRSWVYNLTGIKWNLLGPFRSYQIVVSPLICLLLNKFGAILHTPLASIWLSEFFNHLLLPHLSCNFVENHILDTMGGFK